MIREITPDDAPRWAELRKLLWPGSDADHDGEITEFFEGKLTDPAAVLVAESPQKFIIGFAELSIRENVPGLIGKKTGYVEGLYIAPEYRGHGLARRLLRVARIWARDRRCNEFASDRADRIIILHRF